MDEATRQSSHSLRRLQGLLRACLVEIAREARLGGLELDEAMSLLQRLGFIPVSADTHALALTPTAAPARASISGDPKAASDGGGVGAIPRRSQRLPDNRVPFGPDDDEDGPLVRPALVGEELEGRIMRLVGRPLSMLGSTTQQKVYETIDECGGEKALVKAIDEVVDLPSDNIRRSIRSVLASAKMNASRAGFEAAKNRAPQESQQTEGLWR